MIKHVVLFKLKKFENEASKTQKLKQIKTELLELIDKVDTLKSINVGLNCNPNEAYDIALETTFESMDDLATYASHPDHVAVAKVIREVLEERACVDFEQ